MAFKKIFVLICVHIVSVLFIITVCSAKNITLNWDENSDPNIAGYMIYYSVGNGGSSYDGFGIIEGDSPIDVGFVTTITLSGLSETEDYYFVATAYNHEGVESEYSNEVSLMAGPLNLPPKADAGPEQSVDEGSVVSLSGLNSTDSDGCIISFQWQQTGGPEVLLKDPDSAETTFTAPETGTEGTALAFQLTVTDDGGLTSTDDCLVNVSWINEPPLADAGLDQTVSHDEEVQLDATKSSDPDDGIATFLWQQKSGPPVILSDTGAIQPSFRALDVGEEGDSLSFQLTVTDRGGLQATDSCIVNIVGWVNLPPSADAGPNQEVYSGETVNLVGSNSTDPDDGIASYSWGQKAGRPVVLEEPGSVNTTFVAPETGVDGEELAFELTVTDHSGLQSSSNSRVVVLPNVQNLGPKNLWISFVECDVKKISRRKYVANAWVTLIDEDFDFVEGATVTGLWTLNRRALNTESNQTDSKGTATLESRKTWARSGSVFTFTVTGVAKEGYSYDPTSNIRTEDSITVP